MFFAPAIRASSSSFSRRCVARPEGLHYNFELESVMAAIYYDVDLQIHDALSLVHSLRKAGGLSVSLYNDSAPDFDFRTAQGFNVSNGKTRSQGIEVSAVVAVNEFHEFDLVASYARRKYDFTAAAGGQEQIENGNDVDSAPRWLGSARWRWPALH